MYGVISSLISIGVSLCLLFLNNNEEKNNEDKDKDNEKKEKDDHKNDPCIQIATPKPSYYKNIQKYIRHDDCWLY